jgi:preprotein translocase subunit SecG
MRFLLSDVLYYNVLWPKAGIREGWDGHVTLALIVGEIVIGLALMAAIILQQGYTPGMSGGAFGGGFVQPSGYSGKKQGVDELLARITVILAVVFAVITLLLAKMW